MNKNRLGEEHQVKISKNNSLTSRAGFCLPSTSQCSPGKPGGLGELQCWEETLVKSGGQESPQVQSRCDSPLEKHDLPPCFNPSATVVIFCPLGQGKAGGKPWQKPMGWDKNGVQVKCSPKPALQTWSWNAWICSRG